MLEEPDQENDPEQLGTTIQLTMRTKPQECSKTVSEPSSHTGNRMMRSCIDNDHTLRRFLGPLSRMNSGHKVETSACERSSAQK